MNIKTRKANSFVEITVDETTTDIFKDDKYELNDTIINLLEVAHDLTEYTDKSLKEYLDELGI